MTKPQHKQQHQTFRVSYEIPSGLFWSIPADVVAQALTDYYETARYPQPGEIATEETGIPERLGREERGPIEWRAAEPACRAMNSYGTAIELGQLISDDDAPRTVHFPVTVLRDDEIDRIAQRVVDRLRQEDA